MDFKRICYDFICGNHSGFPLCCVTWYALFWNPIMNNDDRWLITGKLKYKYYDLCGWTCGFVKCPLCVVLKKPEPCVYRCSCRDLNYALDSWQKLLNRWLWTDTKKYQD